MSRDYPAKGKKPPKPANPKTVLAQAVDAFMQTPMPERSTDETADQLHAELLLYDSSVGEAVMAVINGERAPEEDLQPNQDLRHDLEQLAATGASVAAATDAAAYLDYLNGLDHLLALARAVTQRKKP